jgi:pimeloyl-ACP methyl ester carboxylesterase
VSAQSKSGGWDALLAADPLRKEGKNSMPKLSHDGVNLYYEIHGNGPAILLSHGYSATVEMWRGQVAPLSRHYQLILWDMRGHGQTDSPDDPAAYSEEATVADMAALLDAAAFGAEQAIVGGLSLGGYMSLAFYLAYPERVRALLLFDTGPGFKNVEARAAWNKRALETASSFETAGLATLQSKGREMAMSTHRSAQGLARAARGMLAQRDARVMKSLPHIKVPALIIVGADDTAFLASADYMAFKIPNARKIVIPHAGHAANLDQPEVFNQAVAGFLESLEPIN